LRLKKIQCLYYAKKCRFSQEAKIEQILQLSSTENWEGQRPRCPYGGESRAAGTQPLQNLQGFASVAGNTGVSNCK
jgi:hypothetical protein